MVVLLVNLRLKYIRRHPFGFLDFFALKFISLKLKFIYNFLFNIFNVKHSYRAWCPHPDNREIHRLKKKQGTMHMPFLLKTIVTAHLLSRP